MGKHYDILNIYAPNKGEAREKTIEFLRSYKKKHIKIYKINKRHNHYQIEVEYSDEYEVCPVFLTKDFVEINNSRTLSLKNENYQ